MTMAEKITQSLLEEFEEISIEETEMSAFLGIICCCNTVKEPKCKKL